MSYPRFHRHFAVELNGPGGVKWCNAVNSMKLKPALVNVVLGRDLPFTPKRSGFKTWSVDELGNSGKVSSTRFLQKNRWCWSGRASAGEIMQVKTGLKILSKLRPCLLRSGCEVRLLRKTSKAFAGSMLQYCWICTRAKISAGWCKALWRIS